MLRIGPWRDSEAKFYMLKRLFWSPNTIRVLVFEISTGRDTLIKENFTSLLKNVENIFSTWSNRNLTIVGKITVINSLGSSLFIHKLTALPSPGLDFYHQYKKLIRDFLWSNKPAKISYDTLAQNYGKLSLKLVDLETKETALKALWVVKWKNQSEYRSMSWFYEKLEIKQPSDWECNINERDIMKHQKKR